MKRLSFILMLLSFWSCSEEFAGMEDQIAPHIQVLLPQIWEAQAGDTLHFQILISDNDQLHDYYLGLNNLSEMTKEMHWSAHSHAQAITLDTSYVLARELPYSHFQLQIEASDHQGNVIRKRIGIFVKGKG